MTLDSIPLADYNISIPVSATRDLIAGDERILHFTTLRKFILFIKSIFTGVYEPDVYRHIFHHLHEIEQEMDLFAQQWKPMNAFTRFIDLASESQREHFAIAFTDHTSLDNTVIATFKFKDTALCDVLLSSDNAAQLIDIYASCESDITNNISLHKDAGSHLKSDSISVNEFFVKHCYDMIVNVATSSHEEADDPRYNKEAINGSVKDFEKNNVYISPLLMCEKTLEYMTIPPVA